MTIKPIRFALALTLAVCALASAPARAKDVYKRYLDPSIPSHHAALDIVASLADEPNDAGLHNDLGCMLARLGYTRDALREFQEAARLDKKDDTPLFNAGLVHAYKGSWRTARGSFRSAVGRDPGNWAAWWMIGFSDERLGHDEAALDGYARSLRNDTSLFDVSRNPFAANTRLKARVLLQTYEKRLVLAAMPIAGQLNDPERIAVYYRRSRAGAPSVVIAAPAAQETPAPEPVVGSTGPVVTSAPAAGSPGPGRATQPQQGTVGGGERIQFRPAPARGFPTRPVAEPGAQPPQPAQPPRRFGAPPDVQQQPPAAPTPKAPGPGGANDDEE